MKEKKTKKQLKKGKNNPEKSEKWVQKTQKSNDKLLFAWRIQRKAHEYDGYLCNYSRREIFILQHLKNSTWKSVKFGTFGQLYVKRGFFERRRCQ